MYADRTHLRDHEFKVRLNEDEAALLKELARFNRTQPSVLLREIFLEELSKAQTNSDQLRLTA